jgi:heterodisulfide reductase subunit A-like polyferredoxin
MTSRRELLKGLAAGSATALVAGAAGAATAAKPGPWDAEADVLVVGSGVAGTAAALAAAARGAKVIILEKMPFQGGTTDRKSTRLNSSHNPASRMPSSA